LAPAFKTNLSKVNSTNNMNSILDFSRLFEDESKEKSSKEDEDKIQIVRKKTQKLINFYRQLKET
jgi:hypothetical protein